MSLGALLATLGLVPTARAAGPYEPNETTLNAAGPLGSGQTVAGALEMQSDRDFFYFYVTAPRGAALTIALSNLGGGPAGSSNMAATIYDTASTPVGGLSYVSGGQTRTATVTLEAGKYFVEVAPNEGYGDSYSLVGSGGAGAFGSYASIAARCTKSKRAVAKGKRRLRRAQAKKQRATARLRRSRYSTPAARRTARHAYRKARKRIKVRKRALNRAKRSRSPWCQIPQ